MRSAVYLTPTHQPTTKYTNFIVWSILNLVSLAFSWEYRIVWHKINVIQHTGKWLEYDIFYCFRVFWRRFLRGPLGFLYVISAGIYLHKSSWYWNISC